MLLLNGTKPHKNKESEEPIRAVETNFAFSYDGVKLHNLVEFPQIYMGK